jgi:hypothetical protein
MLQTLPAPTHLAKHHVTSETEKFTKPENYGMSQPAASVKLHHVVTNTLTARRPKSSMGGHFGAKMAQDARRSWSLFSLSAKWRRRNALLQ